MLTREGVKNMPIIDWNVSLMLGVSPFDDHHKRLVDLINLVYDNLITDAPREVTELVLNELLEYTIYHFSEEELWMEQHAYPKLDDQKREHSQFILRIENLLEEHRTQNAPLSPDTLSFLMNWLSQHIKQKDIQYGVYMAQQGIPLSVL